MAEIIYFTFYNIFTKYWNMGYIVLTCHVGGPISFFPPLMRMLQT